MKAIESANVQRREDTAGLTSILPSRRLSPNGLPAGSLRHNFVWTLAGNLMYAGTQWGILFVLARWGTPELVGQFSLGLAVTAPIMLFASLQLRAVQATDARMLFAFSDYAGLRVITTIVAVCVIAGISGLLYHGETALTVAAFGLSKGIESLSDAFYGVWQQRERMDLIAKSLMLRGWAALVVSVVCFVVSHKVWIAVCGLAGAWAAVFVAFDLPRGMTVAGQMRQSVVPRFDMCRLKHLVRLSLPLGAVTMLISFNANIPRYMISHFRTVRELGIFSALGYFLVGGGIIAGALGQSTIPRLALYAAHGNTHSFNRLSYRLLAIGMAMGGCGVLAAQAFGRQAIAFVYGPEYAQASHLLLWLMIASGAGYMASFAGTSLTAARHFRIQLPLYGSLTALILALSYVMVRLDGAVGVSKALAIAALIHMAAILIILRRAEMRRRAKPANDTSMPGRHAELNQENPAL